MLFILHNHAMYDDACFDDVIKVIMLFILHNHAIYYDACFDDVIKGFNVAIVCLDFGL